MDVSDLRKRILRALDEARQDAATRRSSSDEAREAWDRLLDTVIVPVLRQAQGILKAEAQLFTVHAPAGTARLASDKSAETFIEFSLDLSGQRPQVIGRTSVARGRQRVAVVEQAIAPDKAVTDLGDDDIAGFLVKELPGLVARS